MKILFFTDSHIRGTAPKNRKDNFVETLEIKFKEIKKIIDTNNIDFFFHGGDLFDRPDISISIVSRFAKILNSINVPIYVTSGNHDIYGHNPSTINRTMLGFLDALNIVNIINQNEKIILEKNDIRIQLTGQPYVYDIDTSLNKDYYKVKDIIDKDIDYSIHIVHGMLLDKPFIEGVPFTLIDEIKDTLADITLSGHYHSGFKNTLINGKHFINPGSMVRISNSISEMERNPKGVIIKLSKNIEIESVFLKSAKKGIDVLDRDKIDQNLYKNERLYEFKQIIDSSLDFEKMDINDVLIQMSNSEGVSEAVKKESLRRIAESQMKGLVE